MSQQKVLAVSKRPHTLDGLVGQEKIISLLKEQEKSERLPHFYLISGTIGSGKTTLARIIALALQIGKFDDVKESDYINYNKYDIMEINAANDNSVDFIRGLIKKLAYTPMSFGDITSRVKVVILDESHQLTSAAQNALLTETEDSMSHVFFIFVTSVESKIIAALKRRAFILQPCLLTDDAIHKLITSSLPTTAHTDIDAKKLIEFQQELIENGTRSAGIILQALERLLCGFSVKESVTFVDSSTKLDTFAICQNVAKGSWENTASLAKTMEKGDIYSVRQCVYGYLKTILLKSSGQKAIVLSNAILVLGNYTEEVAPFLANLCLACNELSRKSSTLESSVLKKIK
jgi:DNA polymerase-3 subunit gamma/tau